MEAELNKVWKEVFVPIVREMENTYKNFAFFDLKGMDIVQQSRALLLDVVEYDRCTRLRICRCDCESDAVGCACYKRYFSL